MKIANKAKQKRGNPAWKKGGPSPNPTGRPRVAAHVREIAMERTAEAMEKLWALTRGKGMVQLKALELWLAYGPGKPMHRVEHSGTIGGPVDLSKLSMQELESLNALLARAAVSDDAPASVGAGAAPPPGTS